MKLLVVALTTLAIAGTGQKDYRYLIGQSARMCGTVVSYSFENNDCSVRLDFVRPISNPLFYALIPASVTGKFPALPAAYLHQQVCISGLVEAGEEGVPRIVGTEPAQLVVTTARLVPEFGAGIRRVCGTQKPPKLRKEIKPNYSVAALQNQIQGVVLLDAIVGIDGTVTDMRVVFSLEPSLDEEAQRAVKRWRFDPPVVDGQVAPVIVQIQMSFTLKR